MTSNNATNQKRYTLVISTIVILVAVVIMSSLGVWQLQRAEEKSLRIEQIEKRKAEDPLSLGELLKSSDDIRDFPFQLYGKIDPHRYFLVDNRQFQGQVGYEVLAPVQTNEGLILVNLGWVKGTKYRANLPDVSLPKGTLFFQGIVSLPDLNPMISETALADDSWPKVIQQIDLALLESFLQEPLLGFVMLLSPESEEGFVREWQPVAMPPEKHLGYAIQWFGLALASLLVYIFAVRSKLKDRHD